ncbi:hypothetical protein HDV62DRAFT_182624 [Trichoderma sp. SZMC 28011]
MGRLGLRVLKFGFSPWTIFTPYTILGEIYFSFEYLCWAMCTHTRRRERRRMEGRGQTNTAGNFGCTATIFWAKISWEGRMCINSFFLVVAFILCWMWRDADLGCM